MNLGFDFFTPNSEHGYLAFYVLIGLFFLSLILIFLTYKYRKYKRFQEFVDEMKQLDLDEEQENTLAGMVKRYSMDEPVKILMSARLFDEMAAREIEMVLGSAASANAKKQFINMVYDIRKKTYAPDVWMSHTPIGQAM